MLYIQIAYMKRKLEFVYSGGCKGGASYSPIFSGFHTFFLEKLTKLYVDAPGSAPPPTGNPGSAPGLIYASA